MKKIKLFGLGIQSRSSNVTAQRRVNMYLEVIADGDKMDIVAYRTPGLRYILNIGNNPVRGWYATDTILYVVAGNQLFTVNAVFDVTSIGTLNTVTGNVGIASNGLGLLIVDGVDYYTYIFATTTFAVGADAGYLGGDTVTFLNSFYIVNVPGTGQFQISASYDGDAWDAAEVATAESNPDNLIAVFSDQGQLILFGDVVTEIWLGVGDVDFPFQRAGAAIEWGIAARWSVAKFNDSVVFLAKNRLGEVQIVQLNGYTVQRISTHDIENIINGYTNIAGATAFSYMHNGHPFYQINFDGGSWIYDGTSSAWSQVKGYGIDRHRADKAIVFNNDIFVSDFEDSNIYTPDENVYTDNGEPLISELTSKHIYSNGERIQLSKLLIDCETGVGVDNGQGSDPQMEIQIYKDGGHVPLNSRYISLGKKGEYKKRCIIHRLGQARDWTFTATVSDPVKWVVMGAYVE